MRSTTRLSLWRMAFLSGFLSTTQASVALDTLPVPVSAPQSVCHSILVGEPTRTVTLKQTFRDDFDQHPLANGRWSPHFLGSRNWPEKLYWGGVHSDKKRRLPQNGEQQIYVDPRYQGLADHPLGLDPFSVHGGLLTVKARRTPSEMKSSLFDADYISGVLTSANSFSQKYGYFEIRARVPFGSAVWPAFWLLPDDASWPPEVDVFEGRGTRRGVLAMSLHWKGEGGRHGTCSTDRTIPDAAERFHTYGVLWEPETLTWYVDRVPVFTAPANPHLERPMYMLINLAVGSKTMSGVGQIDENTPREIEFVIDHVAAWSIGSP